MARDLILLRDHHPMQFLAKTKFDRPGAQLQVMMDMPYPADPITEPHLVGMTFGQVALMCQVVKAAAGDGFALDRVLDRTIGKAVNTNVNLNKDMTYQDFLDDLAMKDSKVIDVQAEGSHGTGVPVRESDKIS